MDKTVADKLLTQTRGNYDLFAESFSQTRNYVWPEMKSLADDFSKRGRRVLDIGCGNGRYYPVFKEREAEYTGIDSSRKLIAIARKNFPEANFAVADALKLPFKENEFDLAVSIAVLHHIPSEKNRELFFKEVSRVLKSGGIFIVTVWDLRPFSMIKARRWKRFQNFAKTQIKIAAGREPLDFGDFFIAWQNRYQRYHHAFSLEELKKLAVAAGFKIERNGVSNSGLREANLYIVAKKLQN
ncbi:MAG: methyltransferase domain-containing protein [Minisyncoccales bacterium]